MYTTLERSDTQYTLAATTLLARSIASIFHVSNDSKNCIRKLKYVYLHGEKEVRITWERKMWSKMKGANTE
jgi:hypothetical protein